MYIAEIEITDFQSFRGTHKLSLDRGNGIYAGWTVFVGRNGSGKSALLKAIAAAAAGPSAIRALAGFPNWIHGSCARAQVKATLVADPKVDPRHVASASSVDVSLEWVRVPLSNGGGTAFGSGAASGASGPWCDNSQGLFIAGYGAYRHVGAPAAAVSQFNADEKLSRLVSLYSEAPTLIDAMEWIKGVHAAALEEEPGAVDLRDSVLALLNDGLLSDGHRVRRIDSGGLWIERAGKVYPFAQLGDGGSAVVALVLDIARRLHACYHDLKLKGVPGTISCPWPGVILIDEVEAHLHVEWQQKIGFWLTSHFPNIQFLTTSHSPFVCQAASARGLVRLPHPGEEGSLEHLDTRLFHSIVHGGADDAVMSALFGLKHAHSQRAEQLRRRAAELELKMVTGRATTSEQRAHAEILSALPGDIGEEADRKLRMVRGVGERPRRTAKVHLRKGGCKRGVHGTLETHRKFVAAGEKACRTCARICACGECKALSASQEG